jgi:hypothetical protein
MGRIDKNRLDRLPTNRERWVGIILSALIALLCLPASIVFLSMAGDSSRNRSGYVAMVAFCGLLGAAGLFLFYRLAFTKPETATPKANQIFAWVGVAVTAPIAVLSFVTYTPVANRALAVTLLCVALGNLARLRGRS